MQSIDQDVIEAKAAVIAGGGEYCGIQRGSRQKDIPDLILFNDPLTGTTLALIADEAPITAQSVHAKITYSRAGFAGGRSLNSKETRQCAASRGCAISWQTGCSTEELKGVRP